MRVKPFISWLLTVTLLLLAGSGIILYLAPVGRIAHWSGWHLLGIHKEAWQALHTNVALLFVAAAIWHLVLNWSMLIGYLRKGGWIGPVGGAIALAALFFVATWLQWVPWNFVQQGNDRMKAYWEQRLPRPPSPHAEEWTLEEIAQRLGVSPQDLIQALQKEGIGQPTAQHNLATIASQAGLAPYQVFEAIGRHFPHAEQALQPGWGKRRGQGKKSPPTQPDSEK